MEESTDPLLTRAPRGRRRRDRPRGASRLAQRLRGPSRLTLLVVGLALAASLAPAVGAASAAEVRTITLPIQADQAAKVHWTDTYGAARSGGRPHLGVDMLGAKMIPLVAARSATVIWGKFDDAGGSYLRLRDDEGWEYQYIHLNNDTPGTDDAKARCTQTYSPKLCATVESNGRLTIGTRVAEGEVIAYLGDSGNAETVGSHLHFEIYKPSGSGPQSIDPTPSVDAALARIGKGDRAPAPAAPVAKTPVVPSPPPAAAPGQAGFADWFFYQVSGRYPNTAEKAAFESDIGTQGPWPAMARRVDGSSTAATVDRLYHAFFLRYPDTAGLRYWVCMRGTGLSVAKVAENFAASDEFRLRYPSGDFGQFLDQIYRDVFNREPDPAGKAYWLDLLQAGTVNRGTIVANFSESAEMRYHTENRNELVALNLVQGGTAPTADDNSRWETMRRSMPLSDAIAQWFTTHA